MKLSTVLSSLVGSIMYTSLLASASGIPGRGKGGNKEIVGGVVVRPTDKYPFVVNILYDGEMHCGGAMVGPSTIITASHCTMGMRDRPIPVSALTVFVNRHNMTKKPEDEGAIEYKVVKTVPHPQYSPKDSVRHDIAVWKIAPKDPSKAAAVTRAYETFPKILLESRPTVQHGDLVTVAGWGRMNENHWMTSPLLREVEMPVIDHKNCYNFYKNNKINIKEDQICAGVPEGGKDSCQGDSGGPLFVQRPGLTPVLVGVVSFGIGCGRKDYPGVMSSVSYHYPWLMKTMRELERM